MIVLVGNIMTHVESTFPKRGPKSNKNQSVRLITAGSAGDMLISRLVWHQKIGYGWLFCAGDETLPRVMSRSCSKPLQYQLDQSYLEDHPSWEVVTDHMVSTSRKDL